MIGVLSDTHDQVHLLESVINFFNRQNVSKVIHCGDWVSPFTLRYFTELNAPLYGVFGNNDGDKFLHTRVAQRLNLNITIEDHLLTLDHEGSHIAVYHGTAPKLVDALVKCGEYDVVFYGHNHIAVVEQIGSVLKLNPGTLLASGQTPSIGLYHPVTRTGEIIPITTLGDYGV